MDQKSSKTLGGEPSVEVKDKKILTTKDYSIFKKLNGNRDTDINRINKIIDSIQEVGYITSPILVNENMEVIDGQGRLEAFKQLEIPVEYIIQKGAGIKECVSMNIYQTNWKLIDYIKSYKDLNIKSYVLYYKLIEKYKNLNITIIYTALNGYGKPEHKEIREGQLRFTEEQYEAAVKKLDYLEKFIPYFNKINGKFGQLARAILICYDIKNVDKDRLFEKITTNIRTMTPWIGLPGALQSIEEVYNRNIRNHIYIFTEYRISVDERVGKGFYENSATGRAEAYIKKIQN